MNRIFLLSAFALCLCSPIASSQIQPEPKLGPTKPVVSGELKEWHKVTLTFAGPRTSESAAVNPFRDYRLNVTFTKDEESFVIPGFFAADGNAADSHAKSGNLWQVHFCPPEEGTWTYQVSFRTGTDIATSLDPAEGTPISSDGYLNSLIITATDKAGIDLRGKGLLRYVDGHYLQFAEKGDYFLKGGTNSPENFLAYHEFDQTKAGNVPLHKYQPHVQHFDTLGGGPTWAGDKGKAILGLVNYLASKGMNNIFMIGFTVDGDGDDVWPWTSRTERSRYDVSKLAQWDRVFTHMVEKGIHLHFALQEIEAIYDVDDGELGPDRKVYYREFIARFGHHLALTWNIGEEYSNDAHLAQRRQFASFLRELDPYDHPIALHTLHWEQDLAYNDLLGFEDFEFVSLNVGDNPYYWPDSSFDEATTWLTKSAAAGRPWIVTVDEVRVGVGPDGHADDPFHHTMRKTRLWPTLFAGASGVEWWFGPNYANDGGDDLNTEDLTTRDLMWEQTDHGLQFFHEYLPFWEMTPDRTLITDVTGFAMAKPGETYAVYLPDGNGTHLTLEAGDYSVEWFDPYLGGDLQTGDITLVQGPGSIWLGSPPISFTQDAVALVRIAP